MEYLSVKCVINLLVICLCLQTIILGDERLNNKHLRRKRYAEIADDIRGPYCSTRVDEQCCPGRDDQCTVPILDTLCYCDVFCNETASDCCPDFWNVCHEIEPPPLIRACQRDGAEFPPGHSIRDNCNQCTCVFDPFFSDGFRWNCSRNVCMIQPEIVRAVNQGAMGWTAGNYSVFWGMTLDEGLRHKLGTMPPEDRVLNLKPVKLKITDDLPEEFDARIKWPNQIHPVRDQGNCGASWAFSTVATASDRLAIESQGILAEELSPQHLLSCNRARGQLGCEGGYLDKAWWFLRKKGIVSEECYPYSSGETDDTGSCMLPKAHDQYIVSCPNGLTNSSGRILYTTPPYRIANDELQIMQEIYSNGPVQATMKVKEDFFMYKSGVYKYSSHVPDRLPDGDDRGYHSVRIIGWGVETDPNGNKTKYWLCLNSWGHHWGENGSFRILQRTSDFGVENFVMAATGQTTQRHKMSIQSKLFKGPGCDIMKCITSISVVDSTPFPSFPSKDFDLPAALCFNTWGEFWGEKGLFRIMKNINENMIAELVLGTWGRRKVNLVPGDLCVNSWGDVWGEGGLFRIDRSTNESGIEWFVLAANSRLIWYDWPIIQESVIKESSRKHRDRTDDLDYSVSGMNMRGELYNLYSVINNQRSSIRKRLKVKQY